MKNLFLNNKRIIFFILFLISVASVLWLYLKTRGGESEVLPTPIPKIFELSTIAPRNGVDATILPTTAIEFMFNKSINPDSLIITTNPAIEFAFEVSENRRSVFIRAIEPWVVGVDYEIILSVESSEGEVISGIKYPLRLKKITESDLNETY